MTGYAATFLFAEIKGTPVPPEHPREGEGGLSVPYPLLLQKVFADHGGQERGGREGVLLLSFASATNAVLAAVHAQESAARYRWAGCAEAGVRIGVHTADEPADEKTRLDLSAHPVAGICALGLGGQILISQATRDMLDERKGIPPGIELRDLGRRRLLDDTWTAHLFEVVVRTDAQSFETPALLNTPEIVPTSSRFQRIALPGALRLTAPFSFVGRAAELSALEALLPIAAGAEGRVALIRGEPGGGKTRLIRELARVAASRGVLVLYGACDAVVNAPYQPFVESLEFLVGVLDSQTLRDCVGEGGGELTRLLPDLSSRLGSLPEPRRADPDTERYRLHTAVADLLAEVSLRRPVLLVVDDAHWADVPSLHLLRHLSRARPQTRLLLLAAFRDREPGIRADFSEALADLLRTEGVAHVQLGGLSADEVGDFVRQSARVGPGVEVSTLAGEIGGLTGGNPFLLGELWRTLAEIGGVEITDRQVRLVRPVAQLGSPDSVRAMVHHRLRRLAPETTALLEVAAVIGPEFSLRVLADAARLAGSTLTSSLAEAVRSGMIDEAGGPLLVHRFAHELVRRALYDQLAGVRRAELHLRAGEALERSHVAHLGRVLPELAHHFSLGAAVGGTVRAVEYNLRAGRAAMSSFAFEDAAARFATALELGIDDERQRAQTQLALGLAQHRAGQSPEACAAYRVATAHARSHGDTQILARAAIGFEEASWRSGIGHDEAAGMLDEAAHALDDESPLKARTLAQLTRALMYVGQPDRALEVRREAVAMAQRVGDPLAQAWALALAYHARGTIPRRDVLEMLHEARELGDKLGDAELVADTTAWIAVTLVELCDLNAARGKIDALRRAAEQTRQSFPLYIAHQHGSALALCVGRLAEAEAMAEQSWHWSRRLYDRSRSAEYGLQMFSIRREQGRLAELKPVIELLSGHGGATSSWRPGLVVLLAELGMDEAARAELERMRADEFASVPRDGLRVASLTYLTDACSALQDARSAALLYPELLFLAGGNIRIGQLTACYGAADRYLGMLATTMSQWDTAEAHFEHALQLNQRMGAHTWTAHSAYEYGRMLLNRGSPPDHERATQLLAHAARSAERYGLRTLTGKIRALVDTPHAATTYPDGLSAREVEVLRLVAQGRSNREIGDQLFISEHTAANHIRNILRKTRCANRTDAASYAHRHGLTQG